MSKQEAVITYNPLLASQPEQMVATFTHELAHYLTATASEPPPGGWESSRNGYLSEAEHAYALAIFLGLKKIPIANALKYLKPSIKSMLKKAAKEIRQEEVLDELYEIRFQAKNSGK